MLGDEYFRHETFNGFLVQTKKPSFFEKNEG